MEQPNKQIAAWIAEQFEDYLIIFSPGKFEDYQNDRSSAGWGCNTPIISGFKVAWIQLSPQHKGDKPTVFYDYITA